MASEATAKVPVLEKRISTLESQEMERSHVIENLRVQGKLLMNDFEKEQENLGFAQGLLSKVWLWDLCSTFVIVENGLLNIGWRVKSFTRTRN